MKKNLDYKDGKFIIEFEFNEEHLRTLFLIKANDGYVAFENRNITIGEDMDGNEISWNICDELAEMGFLIEDEEAWNIAFELTNDGEKAMKMIKSKY